MLSTFTLSLLFLAACFLVYVLIQPKDAKIRGLSEIPGWPIVGNLLQLRHAGSPSSQFEQWAKKYGPMYQVRLGVHRVVVANSFDSIKKLWVDNQNSMINRPMLYTFHSVVSSTQGFTIGSSPWDPEGSCKRRRKAAARVLNAPAVQSYMPAISRENEYSISDMYQDAQANGFISPKLYFKKFVLNMSLTVSFGTRLSSVRDEALAEIVEVEENLTRFRSHTHNLQDYLPFLRILKSDNKIADHFRVRRDRYMNMLMSQLRKDIENGVDVPCSFGNVLKNEKESFTEIELRSVSLTLLSAGLDTIPTNLIQGCALLASPQGQPIQSKLFAILLEQYTTFDAAWAALAAEEHVPYLKAFVQEVLRYYCVVPMGFPRSNITPFSLPNSDTSFPEGTRFYMNTRAANFDPLKFPDPETFDPERFLHAEKAEGTEMPHYTFGAGTRMCVGWRLATRLMYVMFGRMVLSWKIGAKGEVILDPRTYNECETSLVAEPPDFECTLEPREIAKEKLEALATLSQKSGRWEGW